MKKIGRQAIATAIITGKSKASALAATGIGCGDTSAASPSTQSRLKMLLPTMLPTAMSRSPRMAAMTEVASSGSEVPTAITVRPMTSSDRPSARASDTAPSTRKSEPSTSSTRPAITSTALINQA